MARRRRSSKLGSAKVCRVVRGRVKCVSKKLSGMKRRSRMGAMPGRNAKGQFKKSR
jgi:hypothetical protein